MKSARVEVWIWVLVYAGLVVFGMGLAVQRSDDSFGWGVAVVGALLIAAGALLVWVRSRMKPEPPQPKRTTP